MAAIFEALRKPVMQAPIGSASSVELALAVANAGGIGSLASTWDDERAVEAAVEAMNAGTDGFYALNFVLTFQPRTIDAALAAGARMITLSWGLSPDLARKVQRAGALLGIQVGSLQGAIQAQDAGADFLICQGSEAGGHVQSSSPLSTLLPAVLEVATVPVVAAGGIATASDVAGVLAAGAAVAALGTRFVNAIESRAHPLYQQAIIDASAQDTALSCCFDGGWPLSNSRVLRNPTLERWEASGCPPAGSRPGEQDLVATTASGWQIPRYHIASPVSTTTGDVQDLALYAGKSVAGIKDVLPAATIVEQLCPTGG